MIVKITIEVDSDTDLTSKQLMLIQAEMYRCCHNLEEHRFTRNTNISCKPLNIDGIAGYTYEPTTT